MFFHKKKGGIIFLASGALILSGCQSDGRVAEESAPESSQTSQVGNNFSTR